MIAFVNLQSHWQLTVTNIICIDDRNSQCLFALETDCGCMMYHAQVADCALIFFCWIEYVECSNGRMMFSSIISNTMHGKRTPSFGAVRTEPNILVLPCTIPWCSNRWLLSTASLHEHVHSRDFYSLLTETLIAMKTGSTQTPQFFDSTELRWHTLIN